MVLGHPKIIKDHVLEKYIKTYAKTNLKFDGKWTDPLSITKKILKNKNRQSKTDLVTTKCSVTQFRSNDYSSTDEDEMTLDQLKDRNQELGEGLMQQLEIFEQYCKVALLKKQQMDIELAAEKKAAKILKFQADRQLK